MRKKRSIRDVLNDLDKLKEGNPDNKASEEFFAKIQAIRDEEQDSTVYAEVDVPDHIYSSGESLFPYMKKARKLQEKNS